MQVPVLGMDPSMRNWGLAYGKLDLDSGELTDICLSVVQPKDLEGKQVRQNSSDLHLTFQLAHHVLEAVSKVKVIFVEVPVGSQSARAMASYGFCIGLLGAVRATGKTLIEVTPTENKKNFTGKGEATKKEMIDTAFEWYPNANWPKQGGKIVASKAEHMADAIASIHAGVQTPLFQQVLELMKGI